MQNNLYLYPNLVKVRKSRMTQSELAKMIGVSQQEISRYEKGEVKVPINYIIDLANICNVSVDYILGREEAKKEECSDKDNILFFYNQLNYENKIRTVERIKTLLELQKQRRT